MDRLESIPGVRHGPAYCCYLPEMARGALAAHHVELAERLPVGIESRIPLGRCSIVTADALVTEAHGDRRHTAGAFCDAAERWQALGVVTEEAFALLGQGRCLVSLGESAKARPVLQSASTIFERLGAVPSLKEARALLRDHAGS